MQYPAIKHGATVAICSCVKNGSQHLHWVLDHPPALPLLRTQAIYLKMMAKKPGLNTSNELVQTELDLMYKDRYGDLHLPDAYEVEF